MRVLLVAALVFFGAKSAVAHSLPGKNYPIEAKDIKFQYIAYDGSFFERCEHKLESSLTQDWLVTCGEEKKRSFRVKLWLKRVSRKRLPRQSFELIYWIMDRDQPLKSVGTTFWYHFKDAGALHSLSASQAVDSDTATLFMELAIDEAEAPEKALN